MSWLYRNRVLHALRNSIWVGPAAAPAQRATSPLALTLPPARLRSGERDSKK
jgi:hypothetical protein